MPLLSWPFHMPSLLAVGTTSALGGTNSQNTDLTPGLPVSLPGCRLICQVLIRSSPIVSCATPANWTLLSEDLHIAQGFGQWLFWADHGTAAPTINWNSPNLSTTGAIARVFSIINVDTSSRWYWLGNRLDAASSTTVTTASLTTKAAQRLALGFNCVSTLATPFDAPTGETGGTWFEEIEEATTTLGNDATIQIVAAIMPAASTISGGTATIPIASNWLSRTIAVQPLSDMRGEIVYTVNQSPRPQIILDTDIDSDIDDVVDLVMLLKMEEANELDLVAAVVTSAQIHAATTMKAICKYYARDDLIIGTNTSSQGASASLYNDETTTQFPVAGFAQASDFPAAVTVIRTALAAASDKSIEYITSGSLDTVKLLLESTGDGISPLNGIELVKKKVRFFFCVAGGWPQAAGVSDFGGTAPRAVVSDAVLDNWPAREVPIIFGNLPDADDIETGATVMVGLQTANPARFAWVSYFGNANAANKRGAWAQVVFLGAVRGIWPNSVGTNWWRILGRQGLASVHTTTGVTDWDIATLGGHGWLRRMQSKADFVTTINGLIGEPTSPGSP